MALTVPTTRTTGYVMGASVWNAEVVDNMKWLSGDAPSCKAYIATSFAVGTGVASILGFDAEVWDITGMHSTAVNNSRFTAPVAGRYMLIASVQFPSTGTYSGFIEPYLNGLAIGERHGTTFNPASAYGLNLVSEFELAAGGYVEMVAWHNNSVTNALTASCVVKWVGR